MGGLAFPKFQLADGTNHNPVHELWSSALSPGFLVANLGLLAPSPAQPLSAGPFGDRKQQLSPCILPRIP